MELAGKRFGRLVARKRIKANGKIKWICDCDCGNNKEVFQYNLTSGHTLSCGCLKREIIKSGAHTIHGDSKTRLYGIWKGMRKRCENPNSSNYHKYGERGISVCDEWQNWETFKDWAISNGYTNDMSIDRINNEGNYEPDNCRWATAKEQSNNRRNNRRIEYRGEQKTIAEWSEELGISQYVIEARLNLGWSVERALTEPIRK